MKKINTQPSPLPIVFLRGKRVTLRPVLESDIPLFLRWFNDHEIRYFIKSIKPTTEQAEKEWVQSLVKRSHTDIILVIEVKGKPIGNMGIHRINWKDRVAVTGAVIGEKEYWGKGYGTDAKMALLDYAFNTLNLRKIVSHVYAFNRRSLAYSLHCGYRVEGRLKNHRFINGQYHDEIILGLFRDQWLPRWELYKAGKSLSLGQKYS